MLNLLKILKLYSKSNQERIDFKIKPEFLNKK